MRNDFLCFGPPICNSGKMWLAKTLLKLRSPSITLDIFHHVTFGRLLARGDVIARARPFNVAQDDGAHFENYLSTHFLCPQHVPQRSDIICDVFGGREPLVGFSMFLPCA